MRGGVRLGAVACLLVTLLFCGGAVAVDPTLNWRTLQTPHFNIHFHPGEEELAARVAGLAERVHQRLTGELEWRPGERTEVVLSDESASPNGFASPLPFNFIQIYPVVPDEIAGLEDGGDWLETLFIHEYTHVLHLDRVRGFPAAMRRLFGRDPLLFPNMFQPRWITEGLATFLETDRQAGHGRGQSAYYRMLMRMEVARGLKPLRQINLPLRSWPGGSSPYLYGVFFFRFMEQAYGRDAIEALIDDYSDNLIPFRIYSNPRRRFGKNLDQLWQEFGEAIRGEFGAQLEEIRQAGVVQGKPVADPGEYGGMVRAARDGSIYFIRDDGLRRPRLVRRAGGEETELARLRKGARLDQHSASGVLITQPEFCGEYSIYYDLYRYRQGEGLRRLTRCARIRWASWSPDGGSMVALQAHPDGPRLLLLDEAGRTIRELWRGGRDQQISHPDWAPDGNSVVAACWRRGSGWSLCRFDLRQGVWHSLLADGSVVGQPQFTPDGGHLLFVSDHGGIYDLRRMDLGDGSVTTLTRVEGGAFHPSQGVPDGPIYYTNFGGGGPALYRLERPLSRPLQVSAPATALPASEAGEQELASSPYSPWGSLRPRHWLPHLAISPDVLELGFVTSGQDALGIHGYLLNAAWEANTGTLLGSFNYSYSNRFSLSASRYNGYYLDGNGAELQRVRQRDTLQAEMAFPYSHVDYFWNFKLAVASDREQDIWRVDAAGEEGSTSDNLAGGILQFDSSRRFIHSISRGEGRRVGLVLESSDLLPGSDYSGTTLVADWREYLPLGGQQVLALRLALGWGTGQPKPFRLGGEAGGVLDVLSTAGSRLNQRDFALRGYPVGLAQLQGRRMQLASLEWRFPLGLIERGWMAPPLGLQQLSGRLFVDSGAAWQRGNSPDAWFTGAGAELLSDVNLFYFLDLRLRIGYAHGFDAGGGDRLYIALGSSF
ncbi:MAG TPA: hypothetical protein ENJ43_04485 [Gammaproteobacteria bacterium]|nr:hypothetical protein [Gammaproteobacteria bacterium]